MALSDINFQEGEGEDFITELPTGTLNAPLDILIETSGSQFPVEEIPTPAGGGGTKIFIIDD